MADESFRVVVLPGCEAISAAAAEALEAFGRSDGLVVSVGAPPRLGESAEATERVQTAMDKLFNGDGGVIVEQSALASHLAESGCRTIDLSEPNPDILCTQRDLEWLRAVLHRERERGGAAHPPEHAHEWATGRVPPGGRLYRAL